VTQPRFHDVHPSLPSWLAVLEQHLAVQFTEERIDLQRATKAVVHTRGKRLRPVLLLLACDVFGEVTARAVRHAAMVELIHTASLVHDDVVDEAETRRGELSARARWGNKFAVLLGDFLFARVFTLATADGDAEVLTTLASTAEEMGRSTILELSGLDLDAEEAIYWEVIRGKTAALFAAATRIGALAGGAALEHQEAMYRFGEAFGLAFQLADDLLDWQGSAFETGKPLAADWQQRRVTLPLLHALRAAAPHEAEQACGLWNRHPFGEDDLTELRRFIADHDGFDAGWRQVEHRLATAEQCLHGLPDTCGRAALQRICTASFPLPVLPAVASPST
jgi:octaprenyl-diphosphate synthase